MNHIQGEGSQASAVAVINAGAGVAGALEPPHPNKDNPLTLSPLKPVASRSDLRFIVNEGLVAAIRVSPELEKCRRVAEASSLSRAKGRWWRPLKFGGGGGGN
jgi:hypothetical protein